MGLLDGADVFGLATRFKWMPNPTAQQINEFFGVSGLQSLFGGERGSVLTVTGVFFGASAADVIAQETRLLTYRDGIARTITDNWGTVYPGFIFSGRYQRDDSNITPARTSFGLWGWGLPYTVVFEGL